MGTITQNASFADTRPHYEILDGLRGVAALAVVWYHVFEGFAFAGGEAIIKGINHGYLAVDFFFILSGFVISYAYDGRWAGRKPKDNDAVPGKLTLKSFFLRRIIRLHPMVIIGAVTGAVTFLLQGSEQWDGTHTSTSMVMLALLAAMFMIPAVPGAPREVRGNGEMFPLNGPAWSLFFEYIGNILYAFIIRRLPTKSLAVVTAALGIGLGAFAVLDVSGYGSIGVGWTLDCVNFTGGLLRMLFPFSMGMLLARTFRPRKIRGAFWLCSAALLVLFLVPFIGGKCCTGTVSLNGIFEIACIAMVFPAIVMAGASGSLTDTFSSKACRFLGDISYPLYMIHYPFMYLFYSWMIKTGVHTFAGTWPVVLCLFAWVVLFAWLCMKFIEIPVRKRLGKMLVK